MTSRRLLSCFEMSSFDDDSTISHLTDTHEEVLRLDFTTNHLGIVIDFYLFCKDSALLILFLDELVTDLDCIHQGLILTDNLRLVLLEGHHDSFMGYFAGFNL